MSGSGIDDGGDGGGWLDVRRRYTRHYTIQDYREECYLRGQTVCSAVYNLKTRRACKRGRESDESTH